MIDIFDSNKNYNFSVLKYILKKMKNKPYIMRIIWLTEEWTKG